jgi:hypothetical protein
VKVIEVTFVLVVKLNLDFPVIGKGEGDGPAGEAHLVPAARRDHGEVAKRAGRHAEPPGEGHFARAGVADQQLPGVIGDA